MPDNSANSKRIANNTMLLYVRMLFIMVVQLFTSRVVLNTLGVEDYGIYSVVGGIIVILAFLNNAMTGATQRFLNFELGQGNKEKLRQVFSTSLIIHFCVSGVILLLAETIGLWFLNTQMNIVDNRMVAANYVYQFSVAAFIISVISVPYNAAIIAHEKMSAFAYISVVEVVLKLLIVYLLVLTSFDKLIFYAVLIMCVQIIVNIICCTYCNMYFDVCNKMSFDVDKSMLRSMLSFSVWTIFGNLGYILHTQGIAILINIFFGATVNAAQGIANQINGVVRNFSGNFLTALNPQIVKTYAAGNLDDMHQLILRGCRIAFCMVLILILPLTIETPMILRLWLKIVPEYTVVFVRLVLLITLFDSISGIMATSKGATGNIKIYQITLTTIGAFHVPLAWLFFALGYEAYYAMYVYLFIIIVLQIVRSTFVCKSIQLSFCRLLNDAVYRMALTGALSLLLPLFLHLSLPESILSALLTIIISVISAALFSFYIGLFKDERVKLIQVAKKKVPFLSKE